ncbi:MAG: hypothetical protein M3P14_03345 [Chloroflexota bacterium]|nr:hypothetical protein [Chloroflexota bacterium]
MFELFDAASGNFLGDFDSTDEAAEFVRDAIPVDAISGLELLTVSRDGLRALVSRGAEVIAEAGATPDIEATPYTLHGLGRNDRWEILPAQGSSFRVIIGTKALFFSYAFRTSPIHPGPLEADVETDTGGTAIDWHTESSLPASVLAARSVAQ